MRIIWAPIAVERVSEITQYIAQDNFSAAMKWVDELFGKVDVLSQFPLSGRVVPEMDRQDIRELIFGNYRIVYRIGADVISILSIRHGRQILPRDEIE